MCLLEKMGIKSTKRNCGNYILSDSTALNSLSPHTMELNNLETVREDHPGSNQSLKTDFESAIELTGYGTFHYFLLVVCGFVSTSEEMDVISMSFILPSAQCDLNLSTHAKGWLNSIIFIGMMVGAYFWGSIADTVGRKKVLIAISFMNAFCIVGSSLCQSFRSFMFFRFLNGAALGGSGPVTWSYFAEFQPKEKRGSMLSSMAAFWTLGNLVVAALAWIVIPSSIGYFTETFSYNSWRIFLLLCSIPSFVVAILLFFLPESPKFLLSRGKNENALKVLRQIYFMNCCNKDKNSNKHYPVTELTNDGNYPNKCQNYLRNSTKKGKYSLMVQDIIGNSKQLFTPPILRFTLISTLINFTFHIGYYGLLMWFPELFNRFEEYDKVFPNQEASLCNVTDYVIKYGSQKNSTCSTTIDSMIFLESLVTVTAAIPGNFLAIFGMDRLGRKFFLVFSTFSSGICAFSINFVYRKRHHLILMTVFSGLISCGNAALDCIMTEIFPTNLRATGVAISMIAARLGGIIGNIIIATLLDIYCSTPIMIVSALLISGGSLSLLLPNTTKEPLS